MNADNDADFPWTIDVNVFMTPKSQTTWSTNTVDNSSVHNGQKTSASTQNSVIAWDLVLAKGTWTIELTHVKHTDRGIYSVQIDSVQVGTIDGYDGGGAVRNTLSTISSVSVATSGRHELKLVMATKNASSSDYRGDIHHVRLLRTA